MPRTAVLTIVSVTLVFAAVAWTWLKDRVWEDAKLATPDEFISLLFEEPTGRQPAMEKIARTWQPGYAVMALETLPFSRDASVTRFLISTLEENTGERFGHPRKITPGTPSSRAACTGASTPSSVPTSHRIGRPTSASTKSAGAECARTASRRCGHRR